jgi:hypothetical protein
MSSSGLRLITLCPYLTDVSAPWTTADYTAYKMVKALKGYPIKGYFDIKIAGQMRRFRQDNIGEFVERIPRALAKNIARQQIGPATLVPIPNSHVTSASTPNFKTLELAQKVAAHSGGQLSVTPALVFSEPQVKSHEGGPRSPHHCFNAYCLESPVEGPIVLLDDVCTSGGHLIGAFWKLNSPSRNILLACAFGQPLIDP